MKTNLDKVFKTNESLEENGVWYAVSDETQFLVRRMSRANPRGKAAVAKYFTPFASQVAAGTLDPKKERSLMIRIFIDVCMVDWKGVEIDGKEVEYSPEVAFEFFTALPDLCDTLRAHAEDSKNYRVELGNS